MDPILVVSPHMDDAALSCGQMLAGWPGAFVLTVFGGMPSVPRVTTFDVNSGFLNSTEAITARAHEDDRAMQVLQARPLRSAFLDNQYQLLEDDPTPPDIDEIVEVIVSTAESTGASRLFGPLGLAHPDHVAAGTATRVAAARVKCPVWLYEELPVRVTHPELVGPRLDELHGWNTKLEFVGDGPLPTKRAAIDCYVSQRWALDDNVIFAPERFWRLG